MGAFGRRLRQHRQLQHGRALALAEQRHQHAAAVGKFDRVMVTVRHMAVDLAELADAEIDLAGPDPAVVVSDVLGEGEFRSGSMQTATLGSLSLAKPRVEVPGKVVVISVSPTLAGRVATACRL